MQTRVYSHAKLVVTVLDKGATGEGEPGTPGGSGGQKLRHLSEHDKEELSARLATYLNEPREERVYLLGFGLGLGLGFRANPNPNPNPKMNPHPNQERVYLSSAVKTSVKMVRMGKEGTEPATLVSLSVGREEFGEAPAEEVARTLGLGLG